MKKNFVLLFVSTMLLVACGNNNYFDRWPGQKLNTFPAEMQGNYKLNVGFFSDIFSKKKDSILFLTIDENSIHEINKEVNFENVLSDSLVLSKLGKYYIISSKKTDNNGYWTIGYFTMVKGGMNYSPYLGVDKVKEDNLAKYLNLVATYKSGKTVVNAMPLKDRQVFYSTSSDTIKYYEMDDTPFLEFLENEKAQTIIKFNKIYPKKKKQ